MYHLTKTTSLMEISFPINLNTKCSQAWWERNKKKKSRSWYSYQNTEKIVPRRSKYIYLDRTEGRQCNTSTVIFISIICLIHQKRTCNVKDDHLLLVWWCMIFLLHLTYSNHEIVLVLSVGTINRQFFEKCLQLMLNANINILQLFFSLTPLTLKRIFTSNSFRI